MTLMGEMVDGESSPEVVGHQYPEPGWLLLGVFAAYVIYWYLQVGERIQWLGAVRGEAWLAGVLLCYGLFKRGRVSLTIALPAASLLALMAIETYFSFDPAVSRAVFIDRVIKFSVMGLAIVALVRGPRSLRVFLLVFLLACLKIGQEGLWGRLSGGLMWENQGVMRLHGTTSFYTHPNSLSGNAVGSLPFLAFLMPVVGWPWRIALTVQALLALNTIVFTASRTGYVAAATFGAYLIWRFKKSPALAVALVALIVTVVALAPADYRERFRSIITLEEKEGRSAAARLLIAQDAWHVLVAHPLGVGVAAFPAVRTETFGRSQDTHNLFLEVGTNLGVPGLLVFGWFICAILLQLRRVRRDLNSQLERVEGPDRDGVAGLPRGDLAVRHAKDLKLMIGTCQAVECFVWVRLVAGLFGMDLYEVYWWFASGLAIALTNLQAEAAVRTQELTGAVTEREVTAVNEEHL
jgi:putative inorganic carbon (hco3(-)) transporter